jgi:Asp-tRNA(Asn)/Glu-tRNA(Gln) amidotransferase A subunit family amidase
MSNPVQVQAHLASLAAILRAEDQALFHYLDWLEDRFRTYEANLQAFLPEQGRFDRLRAEADQLYGLYKDPEKRPHLFGLPVGVKDIFHVTGFNTHAGSQLPTQAIVGEQADSAARLRQAGALITGKTVTTEFAYFGPGPTKNPHHHGHTPGGSSSGSAAAVAAGLTPLALGTQTIGSINRPAAFCGVVGFKPSFGRISTAGVIPLSPSLDHIGYFTPDAGSAAWVAPMLVDGWYSSTDSQEPLRLAVPTGSYLEHAESAALQQLETDKERLYNAGHTIVEIDAMPDFEEIVERHNLILAAEAAQVHKAWFADFGDTYHPKTAELIRRGKDISRQALEAALPGRLHLREALQVIMDEYDLDGWITPSAPGPAPEGLDSTGDPVMNLPWTHAGMPTVTLPSGRTPEGLPLGLQIIARFGGDEQLLGWGSQLEGLLKYEGVHGLDDFLGSFTS